MIPPITRIFILGAYRSLDGTDHDLTILKDLRDHLRDENFDAYLAIDDRALELLDGRDPPPWQKTRDLAKMSHGLFFVLTGSGRLEGVSAEVTTLQLEEPHRADRRVVFHEEGQPLSAVLDPEKEGVLGVPPVTVVTYRDEQHLRSVAVAHATRIELDRLRRPPPDREPA